ESLRRAALAFGRLGRDAYRPRSKLAQRSRQALGNRGDRAAMRQRRAVEIAEMGIVEVIVGDAEHDALARLGNSLEHAPVQRGGAGPAALRRKHLAEHHALCACRRVLRGGGIGADAEGARVIAQAVQRIGRRKAPQANRGAESGDAPFEGDERARSEKEILDAWRAHDSARRRRDTSWNTALQSPSCCCRSRRTDGYQIMRSLLAP